MKRQEPCFWIQDNCPKCGHSCPVVYSPDLLNGPIERECGSKNNPMRKNRICFHKWGFAATSGKKKEIKQLLETAGRNDELLIEYKTNREKLFRLK